MIRKIGSGALALVALPALAADPDRPAYYDEGWLKINQYSPVEGFESHGSYGWHVGVGVIQTAGSGDKTSELPSRTAPTQVPRLFLTHGTNWPLDFGLSFARLDEGKGRQFGAHLQWTIFEGFQKPAVAIRVARMQADGLSGLEKLETESAMLGLSYGFLRYFNFALGVGQQRHRLDIRPLEEDNAFGLSAGWREQIEKTESVWTLCLKTNLFTPFASLGIERVYTHPRQALTIAKLSYML
ncbi:MAG TPA: hypothetical protein VFO10_21685 [Oligoflexus sp.]|uniref:hypothetical protein n=1 Tax=Oligoflexus sp. TaxID=1971216 RepID=UPI002D7F2BA6|nr:hypothetical protein [Oligoflexus sp.]HET9239888.1 hypothetical protein [Oligoflexus sp.]